MRSLRAARRRMRAQYFLDALMGCAFVAALSVLAAAASRRWLWDGGTVEAEWLAAALVLPFIFAAISALVRRMPLREVARVLDGLGQTHDRFVTALAFTEAAAPSPFHPLALCECRAFLATKKFARLVAIRLPRETRYLLVPMVALLLLQWEAQLAADARRLAAGDAQREVAPTMRQLDQLAKEIEKAADKTADEELKKIAEQLRKSAEQLRAEKNGGDEAGKAAMRELSDLEQMLQQMQKPPAESSPEEMKRLAAALAQNEAMQKAAQAMQAGQLGEAAKELDEAAKQPTKEEAAKTLQEALQRLAQQQKLSEALQKIAQQNAEGGEASQALQQLAEMLRKMAKNEGQPGKGGRPATQQEIKNLLAALQNMKFGEGDQQEGDAQPGGDGENGQITIQSFAKNPDGSQSQQENSHVPAGQPGGERDTGTNETPFGKTAAERGEKGTDAALKGRLGEGESLSQLLPTAGDTSKSKRRYKELYEAMAPAAEDSAMQENIPLGSRFFIKRYFESIRPKE